jgi:hypothetical protein
LKDGKSIQWIVNFFHENKQLKPITVRTYLLEARKLISTEADMDVDFTSVLHDARYEQIWEADKNAANEWAYVPEEAWQRANNMEIIRRYNSLMTSMKQRENMYGLRNKDLVLALHSNISLTRDYKSDSFEHFLKKQFDVDKLSLPERIEMQKLLEASYEGDAFLEKDYVLDDDEPELKERKVLEDPQKSMKVNNEGFDKIKIIEKIKKGNIEKETASIKVIDNRPKRKGKTSEQVTDKIKNSVMALVKEKFGK